MERFKKTSRLIWPAVIFVLAVNCQQEKPIFPKSLPGQWELIAFEVEGENKQEGAFQLDVNEGEWENKLGRLPDVTIFSEDQKYLTEGMFSNDSLAFRKRGIWQMQGDSLLQMISPPGVVNFRMEWKDPNRFAISGRIDYDFDGTRDDLFVGIYQRIQGIEPNGSTEQTN